MSAYDDIIWCHHRMTPCDDNICRLDYTCNPLRCVALIAFVPCLMFRFYFFEFFVGVVVLHIDRVSWIQLLVFYFTVKGVREGQDVEENGKGMAPLSAPLSEKVRAKSSEISWRKKLYFLDTPSLGPPEKCTKILDLNKEISGPLKGPTAVPLRVPLAGALRAHFLITRCGPQNYQSPGARVQCFDADFLALWIRTSSLIKIAAFSEADRCKPVYLCRFSI